MEKKIKFFILLFAIVFYKSSYSQNLWFPDDATWTHNLESQVSSGFVKTYFEKDTIIEDVNCKKFLREFKQTFNPSNISYGFYDPIFMYATSDDNQLYYYEFNEFKLIYDFTLPIGDTITLPYNENVSFDVATNTCPNNTFTITNKGVENIDGIELKWMEIEQEVSTNYFYSGKIYQKLGSTSWFFQSRVDDSSCTVLVQDFNFIGSFICYSDSSINFLSPSSNLCPELNTPLNVENQETLQDVTIYPNPSSSKIQIDNLNNFTDEITIYDVFGKKVESLSNQDLNQTFTLDINHLNSGIYFIRFSNSKKALKFIKE